MKFSAQEEYGLRCLIQIAKKGPDGSMTIPEISRLEGLTATHVAKLMMLLRKGGFITSTRGQSGGYTLAEPVAQIYLSDVLTELGGKLYDDDFCAKHAGHLPICSHDDGCGVRGLWNTIQDAVDTALRGKSLADLIGPTETGPNVQFYTTPQRSKA